MKPRPPVQSARGAIIVMRRALRSRPDGSAGPSASSAPLRLSGCCGVPPH